VIAFTQPATQPVTKSSGHTHNVSSITLLSAYLWLKKHSSVWLLI
jgi:hypothetical protein